MASIPSPSTEDRDFRILIVEDEFLIAEDLQAMLEGLGYRVAGVFDASDAALDFLASQKADLVLMDIRIQGRLDGIEAAQQILEHWDIPVVFLTAYADPPTLARAKRAGAYGFLVKPASVQALEGTIELARFKHATDRRIAHLNRILRVVRAVNQLIVRETDRYRLIQGICDRLVESLGFQRVWLLLLDPDQSPLDFVYAGFPETIADVSMLKPEGRWVRCIEEALNREDVVIIANPIEACQACPLTLGEVPYARYSRRIAFGGKVYGLLSAALDPVYAHDAAMEGLFSELVDDVAYALYLLEVTEKKGYAEARLAARERTLSTLMDNLPGVAYCGLADSERTMRFVSRGIRLLTGYWPDDLIDNARISFARLIHPEDLEKVKEVLAVPHEVPSHVEMTYRILTKTGETRWVWERGTWTGEMEEGVGMIEGVIHDITEEILSRQELAEREQRLRYILEHSTNVFYMHTPDHLITYISPQCEALLGYTPEEAKLRWTTFLTDHPVNREGIARTEAAIQSGLPQPPYELELRRKDGKKIWVEVRESPVVENGLTVAIVGSLTDITERKTAMERIQSERAYFEAVFDAVNDALMIDDAKTGRIIDVNQTTCRMYGYTKDEVLRLSIEDLSAGIPPFTQQEALAHLERAQKEGPQVFEWLAKDKSGRLFWVEVNLHAVKIGEAERFVVSVRDIDDRKRAKEALRISEHRYKALVDHLSNAVVWWTADGTCHYVNPAFCAALGTRPEAWIGKGFLEHLPEKDRKRLRAKIKRLTPDHPHAEDEMHVSFPEKEERILQWTHRGVFDASGHLVEIHSVGRDITEARHTEARLEANLEEIRRFADTQERLEGRIDRLKGEIARLKKRLAKPKRFFRS